MTKAKPFKTDQILLRVTPAQKKQLARAAAAEGLSLSSWLLRLGLLAAAEKTS